MNNPTAKDRYELPISTSSTTAADHWVEGLDLLLESRYGALPKFEQALEADEGFALAHIGLAYLYMVGGNVVAARDSAKQAQSLTS